MNRVLRLARHRAASVLLVALLAALLVALVVPGLLLARATLDWAGAVRLGPEVSIFVRPGTPPRELDVLRAQLQAADGVAEVRLIPREAAFAELGKRVGIAVEGRPNPLPDVLVARFRLLGDPARADALADLARGWPSVETVRADNAGYRRLAAVGAPAGRWAAFAAGALVGGLALGWLLALRTLARVEPAEAALLARMGATRRFVRAPHVALGTLATAVGAAGGLALSFATLAGLAPAWQAAASAAAVGPTGPALTAGMALAAAGAALGTGWLASTFLSWSAPEKRL